ATPPTARPPPLRAAPRSSGEALDQGGVGAVALQLGEDLGERLADDAAAVDRHAVLAAEQEAGVLEVHELVGGAVEGDLLVVTLAPAGDPLGWFPVVLLGLGGRLLCSAASALLDRGDAEQL